MMSFFQRKALGIERRGDALLAVVLRRAKGKLHVETAGEVPLPEKATPEETLQALKEKFDVEMPVIPVFPGTFERWTRAASGSLPPDDIIVLKPRGGKKERGAWLCGPMDAAESFFRALSLLPFPPPFMVPGAHALAFYARHIQNIADENIFMVHAAPPLFRVFAMQKGVIAGYRLFFREVDSFLPELAVWFTAMREGNPQWMPVRMLLDGDAEPILERVSSFSLPPAQRIPPVTGVRHGGCSLALGAAGVFLQDVKTPRIVPESPEVRRVKYVSSRALRLLAVACLVAGTFCFNANYKLWKFTTQAGNLERRGDVSAGEIQAYHALKSLLKSSLEHDRSDSLSGLLSRLGMAAAGARVTVEAVSGAREELRLSGVAPAYAALDRFIEKFRALLPGYTVRLERTESGLREGQTRFSIRIIPEREAAP